MSEKSFMQQIQEREEQYGSLLCVGLDTVPSKIPACLQQEANPQLAFNRAIIDATADQVSCFKLNFAFYTSQGKVGLDALYGSIEYAHEKQIPVILDAKFGDIGHTAGYYAKTAFDSMKADSVTLNPYMGEDSITPFRKYENRTSFILCYTSNVSRIDVQVLHVNPDGDEECPLYLHVAQKIASWNEHQNMGAVVGATAPEELANIRKALGAFIPVLCPGIGAQGGDLEEVLWAGYSGPGSLVINVSRAIINASRKDDFDKAARIEAEMFVQQMKTFFQQYHENLKGV